MNKAYQIVFACPKGAHNINLQLKISKPSLSEKQAMKITAREELVCENPRCGWHGKASETKLLRILPFNWIYSPAA